VFPRTPRQLHRIVDDGRSRHAGEMQQLIAAQPEDVDDFRVQAIDRALGQRGDEVIERGTPALDAGCNLRRERAVAVVAQAVARRGDGRRQVGAS
jgi:hypothetical protein